MTKEDIKMAKLPWTQQVIVGAAICGTVMCSPAIITYAMWKGRKQTKDIGQ